MEFVAVDFETANQTRVSACAIGLVVMHKGTILERAAYLIRPPELRFSRFNIAIHGIRAEDVIDKPCFNELWPELKGYFEGKTVIAHNAAFDLSVLRNTLDTYNIAYPDFNCLCTLSISRRIWPHWPTHRLDYVAGQLGIVFQHHNALEDALAAAEIARKACLAARAGSLKELVSRLGITPRRLGP
ncbi:MAG: exonuclease domain-containing protein [Bacillota bacterium]